MTTGLCPRCGGTDIYFAKRQVIKGPGGAWGVRASMVDTALCKACGEVCSYDKAERNKELIATQPKLSNGFILIVVGVAVVVFLLMG
jgi:hypothetical protein